MIVAGPLVGVEEKPEGSAAAAAASAGAMSVVVDNGNHFREFGICQIGDASYVYTLGEDDVTLTLDDPLAADVEIGDLVLSLTDTALSESQVFAFVQLEDNQPPVRAVVPSAMRTLALSDSLLIGGLTQLNTTPDGYEVRSLPFDQPSIDFSYVSNPDIGQLEIAAAQSIPNAVDTVISPWTEVGSHPDLFALGTSGVDTGAISFASGTYLVIATVRFAAGTGTRRVRLFRGVGIITADVAETRVAADGAAVAAQVSAIVRGGTIADRLKVFVYQDSGAALNVSATGTQLQFIRIG